MSSTRYPLRPWLVAGKFVAATAIVLGTAGDAVNAWHGFLVWAGERLGREWKSLLLAYEKSLLILALVLGAVLIAFLRRMAAHVGGRRARKVRENRVRAAYLAYLERDLAERLDGSIQGTLLYIGMDETRRATLPWHYVHHDPTAEPRVFTSINEAFGLFHRRLLLLGAPGAGKTTSLIHLALCLVEEAKRDPEGPVPLLVNLSGFDALARSPRHPFGRRAIWPSGVSTAFDSWLVRRLADLPVRDLGDVAVAWIEEGRMAFLLDGLDEVAESRVGALVDELNGSFFRRNPDSPMVVCSRIYEYERLVEDPAKRLRLDGAVALQPLSPKQIGDYLKAAGATGLRDALEGDEVLRELARIPLTLDMMVQAYGGLAPTEILPFVGSRHQLFDDYIDRMLRYKARRDAGLPPNLEPENSKEDAPLQYGLDRMKRYLSWLASRLSERSLTGFRPDRLPSLLQHQPTSPPETWSWSPLDLSRVLYAALLSACSAAALLSLGGGSMGGSLWLVLPATVLGALACCLTQFLENSPIGAAVIRVFIPFVGITFFLTYGTVGAALVPPPSLPLREVWADAFLGMLCCLLLALGDELRWNIRTPPLVRAGAGVTLMLAVLLLAGRSDLALWALPLGGALGLLTLLVKNLAGLEWAPKLAAILVTSGLAVLGALGLGSLARLITGEPSTSRVALLLCCWLGLQIRPSTSLILAVSAVLGVTAGGARGAVLAALLGAAWCLWWSNGSNEALLRRRDALDLTVERFLLTPCVVTVLAVQHNGPLRYRRFLDHAVDAMLLKRSGDEYEFVHRLLQDHFAIRELVPQLRIVGGEVQLGAIERLSRQGESSLNVLANLVRHPDSEIRRTAVAAIGRTYTEQAIPLLLRIIKEETDIRVRQEAVLAARSLSFPCLGALSIIVAALADPEPQVRVVAISTVKETHHNALLSIGLADSDPRVVLAALEALGEIEISWAENLVSSLPSTVVEELCPHLRRGLRDSLPSIRRASVLLLAATSSPEALLWAREACCDAEKTVRAAALLTVSKLGDMDDLPALRSRVQSSDEDRCAAIEAIGQLASRPEVNLSEPLRREICRELIPFTLSQATQQAAVRALAKFPDPAALEALVDLHRRRLALVTHAFESIQALTESNLRFDTDGLSRLLHRADFSALVYLAPFFAGEEAATLLRCFFTESNSALRAKAAVLLGLHGDAAVVPALREMAAGRHESTLRRVLHWFGWIEEDGCREAARRTLDSIGNLEAKQVL